MLHIVLAFDSGWLFTIRFAQAAHLLLRLGQCGIGAVGHFVGSGITRTQCDPDELL